MRNFKNVLRVWGFLVSFIVFDLLIDYAYYLENPLYYIPAAIAIGISIWLSVTMIRRMSQRDRLLEARDEQA